MGVFRTGEFMKKLFPQRPPQERRLHERAMLHWQKAAGDRKLVLLDKFDWLSLEDQSSHGFLLRLTDAGQPLVVYVGPVLKDEAGVEDEGIPLKDVPEGSLLARFGCQFQKVLETETPITADYDFTTEAGYRVLCRGALLPLSTDGSKLDHVYGVVSWKSEKVA